MPEKNSHDIIIIIIIIIVYCAEINMIITHRYLNYYKTDQYL